MPDDLVTAELFSGWRNCDEEAFDRCRKILTKRDGNLAYRMLVKDDIHLGNPEYAISRALEIMDIKVSGGCFLVAERIISGDQVCYGLETGQEFRIGKGGSEKRSVQWQDEKKFHLLFRRRKKEHSLAQKERKRINRQMAKRQD